MTDRPEPICPTCDAVLQIALALAAADDGRGLDEAFVWEAAIEKRPLLTYGMARQLTAAIRAEDPSGFDALLADYRGTLGDLAEDRPAAGLSATYWAGNRRPSIAPEPGAKASK